MGHSTAMYLVSETLSLSLLTVCDYPGYPGYPGYTLIRLISVFAHILPDLNSLSHRVALRFCFSLLFDEQLNHSDEMFVSDSSAATPIGALCEQFNEIGQRLLNHYVRVQGQIISQVLVRRRTTM